LIVSHPNDPQHRHLSPADGIRRPFPVRARNNRQHPPASRPAGEGDKSRAADMASVNANLPPALKPSAALNKPPMWRPRPNRSGRQTVVGFVAGLALMACVYAGFAALTDDGTDLHQRPNAVAPAPAAPAVPVPSAKPPQSASPASRAPSGGPTGGLPDSALPTGLPDSALPTLAQTPLAATATAAVTTKTKKPKKPKKSKAPGIVDAGTSAAS
jgi:hypothetical protein